MQLGPFLLVFFCGDRSIGIRVVVRDISLEAGGDRLGRIARHDTDELGVSLVCEAVGARLYFGSRVQIEVGKEAGGRVEVVQDVPKAFDGVIEAFDIEFLGVNVGAADCGIGERANTRQDKEDIG